MEPSLNRPCGLYRTTAPLPGREKEVGAGRLVFYHNHSEQGPPLVLTPHANEHNVWSFHEKGWLVEDSGWPETLAPLLPQGYYVLKRHIHLARPEEVLPERTLVQLGYDRSGRPILFAAQFSGNTISFPERGYGFEDGVFGSLEPAPFVAPGHKPRGTVH